MMDASITRRSLVLGSMAAAIAATAGAVVAPNTAKAADKVTFNLWHSMSGNNQDAINKVVDGFNASQDQYEVVASNQGSYDESTGKFFSLGGGGEAPAIIQIGEQNLKSMIDSNMVKPASDLVDAYDIDTSDLLEQAVNFYTVEDKMWAMPFNCSTPVVYYNKDMFDAAGITEFPTTFEGILDAAKTLHDAKPEVFPVGLFTYGYALDQMVTNLGGFTVNNENGRKERCTEVAYQDQINTIFSWFDQLNKEGLLQFFGSDRTNTNTAFNQQEIALYIETSANARGIIDNAADFEVGVAYLPISDGGERHGVYAGGGALCTVTGLSEDVEKGVAAFYTYSSSADVQSVWAGDTGYYPISQKAYDTDQMKEIYDQYPQLKVSSDQLQASEVSAITAGPLCSQLPQLRTDLQTALESVMNGTDVQEAIDEAADNTNAAIETANMGAA